MSLARLLAHNETLECKSKTLVPREFAEELAKQLRAEKISRRLFRLFPPESILSAPEFNHKWEAEQPLDLPLAELHGIRFKPSNPALQAKLRRADAINVLGAYAWE